MKVMESSYQDEYSPKVVPLKKVVRETPKIKTFYVNSREIAEESDPGQFLMLWVIGVDEVPMSMSSADENGTIGLTVEKVGEATSELHELGEGDLVGVRGPYGEGFDLSGDKLLLVCGGCGTAPLIFGAERAAEEGIEVDVVLAAKTDEDLLFRSRLEEIGANVKVATEDGSAGVKGLAVDALKDLNPYDDYDSAMICGPEMMMVKTAEELDEKDLSVQVSLNRYMKCGIGVCGTCSLDPSGLRVCKDGPVFWYDEIKDTEFGDHRRNAAGEKVDI